MKPWPHPPPYSYKEKMCHLNKSSSKVQWLFIDHKDRQKQETTLQKYTTISLIPFPLATHRNNLKKKTRPHTFQGNPRICICICFTPLLHKRSQAHESLQGSKMSKGTRYYKLNLDHSQYLIHKWELKDLSCWEFQHGRQMAHLCVCITRIMMQKGARTGSYSCNSTCQGFQRNI